MNSTAQQITIKETGEVKELCLIDPATGVNWVADFINGRNVERGEDGESVMTADGYKWWSEIITAHQAIENRKHELRERGINVDAALTEADIQCDLEDEASLVNALLDTLTPA